MSNHASRNDDRTPSTSRGNRTAHASIFRNASGAWPGLDNLSPHLVIGQRSRHRVRASRSEARRRVLRPTLERDGSNFVAGGES